MTGRELMERHVRSFNHAVETGEWEPMLARFADEAELHFENAPAGPFVGIAAIRDAYAARPPDDTLLVLGIQENDDDEVVAGFAWSRGGNGRMIIRHDGGTIRRLTVVFD